MDHGSTQDPTPPAGDNQDIHHKIGHLTRQLHDALKELGYADQLAATVGELPDAQSRLSYIARLTGDAAEKVLNRVDQAKSHNDNLAAEVREVIAASNDPAKPIWATHFGWSAGGSGVGRGLVGGGLGAGAQGQHGGGQQYSELGLHGFKSLDG